MGVPEHWLPKILCWTLFLSIFPVETEPMPMMPMIALFLSFGHPLRRQSLHHLGSDRSTTMNITGYIRLPAHFSTSRQNIPECTDDTGTWYQHRNTEVMSLMSIHFHLSQPILEAPPLGAWRMKSSAWKCETPSRSSTTSLEVIIGYNHLCVILYLCSKMRQLSLGHFQGSSQVAAPSLHVE